jgi:hypothetical protein
LGILWLHSEGPFPIRPIYAAPKGKFVIDDQLVTILADDEKVGSRKVEVVQHVESELQFLSYQFETVNSIPLDARPPKRMKTSSPGWKMLAKMKFHPLFE